MRKTIKDYVLEIQEKRQDVELLEIPKHSSSTEIIKCRCKIHNVIFETSLRDLIRENKKCRECQTVKKLTHNEFVDLIYSFHPNIKILSEFINLKTKIKCQCSNCENEWITLANNLIRKSDCPKCANKNRAIKSKEISKNKIIKKVNKKFPFIIALEEYKGYNKKIKFKCLNCGNVFLSDYPLLSAIDSGCHNCNSQRGVLLQDALLQLKNTHPDLKLISKNYKGICKKYEFECKRCNGKFKTRLNSLLLNKSSCPSCKKSFGERSIEILLNKYNILFENQKLFDGLCLEKPLRCDFYLPDYNTVIEYNGKQHYEEIEFFGGKEYFEIIQKRDNAKKEYLLKNNINLIEVSYTLNKIEDIEKYLISKLKITNNN